MAVGDTDAAIRDLMTSGGYSFPLMLDSGNVGGGYGISVIPTLVLIDSSGNFVKSTSGVVTADALAALVGDVASR